MLKFNVIDGNALPKPSSLSEIQRQIASNIELVPEYDRNGFFISSSIYPNITIQQLELAEAILKASTRSKVTAFGFSNDTKLSNALERFKSAGRFIISPDFNPNVWAQDIGEAVLINNKPHILVFDGPVGAEKQLGEITLKYVGKPKRKDNGDPSRRREVDGGDVNIARNKDGRTIVFMGSKYWSDNYWPSPSGFTKNNPISKAFGVEKVYVIKNPYTLHIDQMITFPKDGVAIMPIIVDRVINEKTFIETNKEINDNIKMMNSSFDEIEKELDSLGFKTLRIKVPYDFIHGALVHNPERNESRTRSYINMIPVSDGEKTSLILPSWFEVLESEKRGWERIKEIERQNKAILEANGFRVVYVKDRFGTHSGDHHCLVGTYTLPINSK